MPNQYAKSRQCFACGAAKPLKMIVCNDCWHRVPMALKDEFSRGTVGDKRRVVRQMIEAARSRKETAI